MMTCHFNFPFSKICFTAVLRRFQKRRVFGLERLHAEEDPLLTAPLALIFGISRNTGHFFGDRTVVKTTTKTVLLLS